MYLNSILHIGKRLYKWFFLLTILLPANVAAVNLYKLKGVYQISNSKELVEFASIVDNGDNHASARLTRDIDIRDYPKLMIGKRSQKPFCGTFDGDGHMIIMNIQSDFTGNYSGSLFRFAKNAVFKNLRLGGKVSTHGKHAASLVSYAYGTCSITNVISSVDLSSDAFDDCIGGLIGIAGENFSDMADITITNCAFIGSISYMGKDASYVDNFGKFAHHGGGIVGWKGLYDSKLYIINSYVDPKSIDKSSQFNTFVRYWPNRDVGLIYCKNCYYSDSVKNYGSSLPYNICQGTRMTAEQFANGTVCDLLNNKNINVPIWKQNIGIDNLPQPTFLQFSAIDNDLFEIGTEEELEYFARMVNTQSNHVNGVLTADINYSGHRLMIGSTRKPYEGCFDGRCHKIFINVISKDKDVALFQCIGNDGIVKNLYVDGIIETSQPGAAGIVSHLNGGFVSNTLSTVSINSTYKGSTHYGGIAAYTKGRSIITNCIYSGKINAPKGTDFAYLVGLSEDTGTVVRNSMAICELDGDSAKDERKVLYSGNPQNVSMDESFLLDRKSMYQGNSSEAIMNQIQSGEIFYRIWGRQIYEAEETISEQQVIIQKNQLILMFIIVVSVLLILVLTIIVFYFKNKHLKIQRQFDFIIREHEAWMLEQQQAMELTGKVDNKLNSMSEYNELRQTDSPNEYTEIPNAINTQEEPTGSAEASDNQIEYKSRMIYNKLLNLMNEKQLYKNVTLDEPSLARELGTNVKYLSTCINRCTHESNFNSWIASYRVNYALSIINENINLDVKTIYISAGFSSYSTFNRHFKEVVGMTAQQYITMKRHSHEQN